ncbi:MAG: OmpA family protein [Methylococcales bacterium]
MNRLLLLLLGLILLGLLAFFCVRNHALTIEEDLSTRTTAALHDQGLNWVQSSLDGRELKLSGMATSAKLRKQAGEIASDIWGVSGVDNQITVAGEDSALTPSLGYQTQFTINNGQVVLNGVVPDLKTRELLINIAKQRFGANNVTEQLNIQSSAPDGWRQAAEAALTQLQMLDKGSAQLTDTTIQVTGTTSSERARRQIQLAVSNVLHPDFQASFNISVPESVHYATDDTAILESRTKPNNPQLTTVAASCQNHFNAILGEQHIRFNVDSDIIDTQSNALLEQLVEVARGCPNARIEIGGHTDSQGSQAYNRKLSTRRAQAVIRYLSAHGIGLNRLSAVGYGELSPIADNQKIEGRAKNRRIEFKVLGN